MTTLRNIQAFPDSTKLQEWLNNSGTKNIHASKYYLGSKKIPKNACREFILNEFLTDMISISAITFTGTKQSETPKITLTITKGIVGVLAITITPPGYNQNKKGFGKYHLDERNSHHIFFDLRNQKMWHMQGTLQVLCDYINNVCLFG